MNISSYASGFTTQLSQISPSSIPGTLWAYYLEYLVYYEPNSWVAKIANACRIIALLVSLPVIILGLLDLASYGIARSLGVIDDVKASTSDKGTIHAPRNGAPLQPPILQVNGIETPTSESAFSDSSDRDSGEDHTRHNRSLRSPLSASMTDADGDPAGSQPPVYYVGENGGKLSGVDVFSPAASMPPSPTISRHNLAYNPAHNSTEMHKDHNLRHRATLNGLAPLKESADD